MLACAIICIIAVLVVEMTVTSTMAVLSFTLFDCLEIRIGTSINAVIVHDYSSLELGSCLLCIPGSNIFFKKADAVSYL